MQRPDAPAPAADPAVFEVATSASDALRANIHVSGRLDARTCPLLASVLRSHVAAGRRYLRVRLPDVDAEDATVRDTLVGAHDCISAVGGTLLVEDAPDALVAAVHDAGVNARPAG